MKAEEWRGSPRQAAVAAAGAGRCRPLPGHPRTARPDTALPLPTPVFYPSGTQPPALPRCPPTGTQLKFFHLGQEEKLSMGFGITEARCPFKRYIKGGKNGVVILNPHRKGSTELRSVTRQARLYLCISQRLDCANNGSGKI